MTLIQQIKDRLRLAKHAILAAFFSNVAHEVDCVIFSHYACEFFKSPLFGEDDRRTLETALAMFPEKVKNDVLIEYVDRRRQAKDIELANFFVSRAEDLTGQEVTEQIDEVVAKAIACLSNIMTGDTEADQTLADLLFIIDHKFPGLAEVKSQSQPTPPLTTETSETVAETVLVVEEVAENSAAEPPPSRYDQLKEFFQRGRLGDEVETKVFTELAREFAHEPRFLTEGGLDILRSSIMANPDKFWVRALREFIYKFQDTTLAEWFVGRLQTIQPTKKTLAEGDPVAWAVRGALAAQAGLGDLYGDNVARTEMSNLCLAILKDFPGLPGNMNKLLNTVQAKGILLDKDSPERRQPLLLRRQNKDTLLTMNEYSSPKFPSAAEGALEKGDDHQHHPGKPNKNGQSKKKKTIGVMAPGLAEAYEELNLQRKQQQRKAS